MAFQYYQNNTAGWGSNQFEFGPPPAYGFQPQQHWRAYDFYSAHAPNPQTEIFQYAMNRLSSGAGPLGVGMHEARHWHRRAYGGIGDITRMLPSEIGHAAAYEAYRSWIHRSPTFQILDGDLERQKEALISLAIAEAAQLWEATGRGYDQYALQTASETAAATASLIFSQTLDHQMLGNDYYRARNATYPNAGDAYAMDDMALMQRQQMGGGAMGGGMMGGPGGMMGGPGGMMGTGTLGGLPRPASAGPIPAPGMRGSPYMGASPMVGGSPYMGAAPMGGGSPYAASASPYAVGGGAAPAAGVGGFVQPGAVPGQAGTASSVQYGSSIASTYPGIENARPTTYGASGYGSNVVPGPPGGTFGGGALGTGGYGAGAGGYGAGAGTYGAGGYGAGGYGAGGYGAGSYGAGGYGGGYGAGGYGAQPQQPVVLVERRRSRHDHGHHHRRHHSVPRTGYY